MLDATNEIVAADAAADNNSIILRQTTFLI